MGNTCKKSVQVSKVQDLETDLDVSFIHKGLVKTQAGVLPKLKVNEMILDFEERLVKNTQDFIVNLYLGICLYSQGFYDSAEQHLKMCLTKGMDYKVMYVLGLIYMHKESFDQAAEYFFNSIRLDPEFWPAYLKSAEICLKNDNLPQVKKLLKRLKFPEENPELYFIKGVYYHKRENLPKSKKYFKKSLKLQFEVGKSYFFLGDIYLLQKNCEKSFECYQNCLTHAKGSMIGLVKVSQAIIYFYSEKFEIMLKTLKESLNYGPHVKTFIKTKGFGNSINNENFFNSVELYLKSEYLEATKQLKQLFRENRQDLIPGMILALSYFKMFKFDKSLHYLKKLQKISQKNENEIALLVCEKVSDLTEKCRLEMDEEVIDETSAAPNKPYSFLLGA